MKNSHQIDQVKLQVPALAVDPQAPAWTVDPQAPAWIVDLQVQDQALLPSVRQVAIFQVRFDNFFIILLLLIMFFCYRFSCITNLIFNFVNSKVFMCYLKAT